MATQIESHIQTSASDTAVEDNPIDLAVGNGQPVVGRGTDARRVAETGRPDRKRTIQKYLKRMPQLRPSGQTWSTFVRNHAADIWACDFVQTYDVFFRTIFVFVIIELESRKVIHVNVTRSPSDSWVAQQLREATPFGEQPTYLIRDNDRSSAHTSRMWRQRLRSCALPCARRAPMRTANVSSAVCAVNVSTTSSFSVRSTCVAS